MVDKVLKNPNKKYTCFHGIATQSKKMIELFELIKRVSQSDAAILIRGETGTGKELAARAIWELSPRNDGPFKAINCATLTNDLAASELFGHVKGAFTGASSDRIGYFEASNHGVIFLDEIAELPLEIQSRLLRVIQEKTVTPVGSTNCRKINVRIISATHKALRVEVEKGSFRQDLMYRLRVVPIYLPPLRERLDDIEVLVWQFIKEFNEYGLRTIDGIEEKAMKAMRDYSWPGNIRELRNNIEYAFNIGEGSTLKITDLTPELQSKPAITDTSNNQSYASIEKEKLLQALKEQGGNKTLAAESISMSRSTFWRKAKQYGIY